MSIVLEADKIGDSESLITVCAVIAVCRALQTVCNIEACVKWVNDVFCDGRKISGILCEAVTDIRTLKTSYYIVGIGINIGQNEFPEDIKNIAGSIVCSEEAANLLAAETAKQLFDIIENFSSADIVSEYRSKLMMLDRPVSFTLNEKKYDGMALDINQCGNLIVKCGEEILTLSSGEISLSSGNFTKKGTE